MSAESKKVKKVTKVEPKLTVTLSKSVVTRIDTVAKVLGLTRSELIEKTLNNFLKELK